MEKLFSPSFDKVHINYLLNNSYNSLETSAPKRSGNYYAYVKKEDASYRIPARITIQKDKSLLIQRYVRKASYEEYTLTNFPSDYQVIGWGPISRTEMAFLTNIQPTPEQAFKTAQEAAYADLAELDERWQTPPEIRKLQPDIDYIWGNRKMGKFLWVSPERNCAVFKEEVFSTSRSRLNPQNFTFVETDTDGNVHCYQLVGLPWHELYNVNANKVFPEFKFRESGNVTQRALSEIIHTIQAKEWRDQDDDFQRDYVWTLENKQALIQSLLDDRDIGRIVLIANDMHEHAIMDGKQRINALIEYVSGYFAVNDIYYHELSRAERHRLTNKVVSVVFLQRKKYSRKELLEYFLAINTAGVPQSKEHMQKVVDLLNTATD